MPGTNTVDEKTFESTGGIDPAAFAAEMFPPKDTGAPEPSTATPSAVSSPGDTAPSGAPPATSAAEGAAAAAGLTQENYDAMPKAWRKELEAEWKTMTPGARKYIHERETQVATGISQYKNGADSWNKVISPFQEVIKQYPDANIPEILATLANNHLQIMQSTPEQRRQHVLQLARGYGVDLTPAQAAAAVAAVGDGTNPTTSTAPPAPTAPDGFSPAQIAILEQTFGPLITNVKQTSEFVNRQLTEAATAEVDKFFSNKENEFANEVADDILDIVKKGQSKDLAEAYGIAVMRNPSVKARYIAALAAKSAPPPSTASKLPNVKSSATPIKSSKKVSIDDTIAGVIAKHYSA
jgi:hypothetical protein